MSIFIKENYSDKSFVVLGETKEHIENLKKLGGKYNPRLSTGPGWIFSNKKLKEVKKYIESGKIEGDKKEEKKEKTKQVKEEKTINKIAKEGQYCDIQKMIANIRNDKWWEKLSKKGKNDNKWETMRHNGVYFGEPYKPLPETVKILYKGKPVTLDSKNTNNKFNVCEEEAAYFYAKQLEVDERLAVTKPERKSFTQNETFNNNFWKDWKKILGKDHKITDFKNVDFTPLKNYISKKSEEKKQDRKKMSKEEKLSERSEKEETKELYGFAIVDGVKIALQNYTVQPPSLYLGHGNHPLRGKIKGRLSPKDITINVSKDSIPKCYIHGNPCNWGEVVENKIVTWIAKWRNPVTEDETYVWLNRTESEWVCASDIEKFNKARKLAKNIESVRKKYRKDLKSDDKGTRQLATAVYLLDELAIRPGTEKDEAKESDTVGLTTLKKSNISFSESQEDEITINFIGKSSIPFLKTFKVEKSVYKNLKSLLSGSSKVDKKVFPDINSMTLNDYLKKLLPELTAKVFRTFKASSILEEELLKNIPKDTEKTYNKKIVYDKVNMKVALILNHKKLGTGDEKVKKLKDKLKEYRNKRKEAKTDKQKETADKNVKATKLKIEEAEFNISTGTSKLNYIDPRVVVSWCKKAEMPIEKIYNKTQLNKFVWAMETETTWKFKE